MIVEVLRVLMEVILMTVDGERTKKQRTVPAAEDMMPVGPG